MSSQRTRSPRNTGPSTQERTILVIPSVPVTGSTQPMQTPVPQAIGTSTDAWTGMSYRLAIAVTSRSTGTDVIYASAPVPVLRPFLRAVSAPNTRSALSPPSR